MNIMRAFKAFFDFIFEERRIILSSPKSTYYINLSSVFQFFFLVFLAVLSLFIYDKHFKYLKKTNLQAIIAYNENLEEVNKRLNHRVKRIENNITVVNKLIPTEVLGEMSVEDPNKIKQNQQIAEKTTNKEEDQEKFSIKEKLLSFLPAKNKIKNFDDISAFEKKISGQLVAMHSKIDALYSTTKNDSKTLGFEAGRAEDFRNIALRNQVLDINAVGGPFEPYVEDYSSYKNETKKKKKSVDLHMNLEKKVSYIKQTMEIIKSAPIGNPGKNISISGHYGPRFDPFSGEKAMHHGVDLTIEDRRIISPRDGVVIRANNNSAGYGKLIILEHKVKDKDGNDIPGKTFITKYGHLHDIIVNEGDIVKQGDVIGIQGNTGRSTGEHLHYEVIMNENGKTKELNPSKLLTLKNS